MKKIVLAALLAAFAGPALADTIYVQPYVKSNGTVVSGHIRTTPNGTCADNLNGC